ncbi:hypothetical protein HDU76_008421, partial [Blyttiomyces sp. JEL0837]
ADEIPVPYQADIVVLPLQRATGLMEHYNKSLGSMLRTYKTPPRITPPGADVSERIAVPDGDELERDHLDTDLPSLFFMPDKKNILETVPHINNWNAQ